MTGRDKESLILRERKTVEISPDPIARKVFLELPEPDLTDNRADVDRLRQELARTLGGPVAIDLDLMRVAPGLLRQSGWSLTAVTGWHGSGWKLTALQSGDTTSRQYGLAVDIGTTTVVAYLVDLRDGKVLDAGADYNGQIKFGDDILSRIFSAGEDEGVALLQRAVVDTLNGIIERLAAKNGVKTDDITAVAVGANTTMAHLFLGLDPGNICVAPYIPAVSSPEAVEAGQLGLALPPKAPVHLLPGVGSYLGGDVVAGVLASGMHRRDELALLVDIGTNGEFVMGNSQWLVACAGAAGPALEGGVAACGMRAEPGAICRLRIDYPSGRIDYSAIGDIPPLGVCGSGLVDGIAQLFLSGRIDRSGRFKNGQDRFVLVPAGSSGSGRDIVISQADINNFLRTKGAVNAALEHLLESVGCGLGEIERFYAAGAFGHHLDLESAVSLGLYPDLPRERMVKLGNSSGEGARLALISRKCLGEAGEIATGITYFELNASVEFMNRFVSSKFIPHTNLDFFPTVKERLTRRGLLKEIK